MQNQLNYPREIFLLHSALSCADHQIIRDYNELGLLQSNKFLPFNFASKLKEIIGRKIINKIERSFPKYGIILNKEIILENNFNDYNVINLIEGEHKLARSLPFFTCNAAICIIHYIDNKIEVNASIALNPILNLFYWANNIKNGAYEKNQRIKTSKVKDLDIASGIKLDAINNVNLNSITLELCFLGSGKLDFMVKKFDYYTDIVAASYIAQNAGGKVKIDFDNKIISAASNDELLNKLLNDSKLST